ncbi:MAG: hypothetical protein ACOX2X_01290 [Peptococcia bacterium]
MKSAQRKKERNTEELMRKHQNGIADALKANHNSAKLGLCSSYMIQVKCREAKAYYNPKRNGRSK